MFLYKLVDLESMDMAKDGILSFSHPIFQYKGSEGRFINFAKRIYDKYEKNGLKIKPSDKDLVDIREWITTYKATYGKGFRDVDIISESKIIFCGIMQGFCGYFTTKNLFNERIFLKYRNIIKTSNKVGVIRIDSSLFQTIHWRTEELCEPFIPFKGNSNDLCGYNGFVHPTKVVYSNNTKSYKKLLSIFNKNNIRHAEIWFNVLPKEYKWQKEYRIIFLLNSLKKNSSTTGSDRVYYLDKNNYSWEEIVYCNIVDAIHYCKKGPSKIFLDIGKENIKTQYIDDITKSDCSS